jgi:hypothetical protein
MVIRSRSGNVVLAALGVTYAVSAFVVLVWFVVDSWAAAAILDRALQLCLAASAACGIWFIVTALENLGVSGPLFRRHHRH